MPAIKRNSLHAVRAAEIHFNIDEARARACRPSTTASASPTDEQLRPGPRPYLWPQSPQLRRPPCSPETLQSLRGAAVVAAAADGGAGTRRRARQRGMRTGSVAALGRSSWPHV
jgi:hypothetical protein